MALNIQDIKTSLNSFFQQIIKNIISLGDDSTLESDLKPIKVGGKVSPVEISETELKIRGTINAEAINVNGSAVQTGTDAGATELNELSDVTYSSGDLTIDSIDKIVASSDLTLDVGGDIELNADGGRVSIKDDSALHFLFDCDSTFLRIYDDTNVNDFFDITVAAEGATTIATTDADTTAGHLTLAPDGDLIFDAAASLVFDTADGKYIAKNNGTEFSATDSAYAGMILGYTQVGADVADDSYALTTSYVVPDSALTVLFKTPPSEKVEIQATFTYVQGSGGRNVFASISNHSTYASNSLVHPDQFDKAVTVGSCRGGNGVVTLSWYISAGNLAAVGSANSLFFAAKCDSTAGAPTIYWGGDATDEYQNFVMKAIALPA